MSEYFSDDDSNAYYDGWYFDDIDLGAESDEVASDIAAGKTAKDVDYGRQDVDYETMYARRKDSATRRHSSMKSLDLSTEYGSEDYKPYRVTINIKEKDDGNFVYSFSAEEQDDQKRKSDAQQTLHAAVNGAKDTANIELSNSSIPQPTPKVNSKKSLSLDTNNQKETFKRGYQLKDIKRIADISNSVLSKIGGLTEDTSTIKYSIADLYQLVKTFDKDFTPAPEVNPALLNEDGMPKVVYHGSDADFTTFDITKSRSWDGTPDYDLHITTKKKSISTKRRKMVI